MNAKLNGGCQAPIAGYAYYMDEQIVLNGLVGLPDGSKLLRATYSGVPEQAQIIGMNVAEALLEQGAEEIMEKLQFGWHHHG